MSAPSRSAELSSSDPPGPDPLSVDPLGDGRPRHVARPATPLDEDTLVAGNLAMARETEGLELDPKVLRAGVRRALTGTVGAAYFLVDGPAGSSAVGQLMVTREWSDWRNREVWWIQSVYVWPEHRGRGVYTTLYERVCADARAAGAGGVRLYVDVRNAPAQAVYARLGMNGDHYRVFEAMFEVPATVD